MHVIYFLLKYVISYITVYIAFRSHRWEKLEWDVGMGVRDRSELMISVMATRAICSTVILNKSSILRPTEAQSIQCAGRLVYSFVRVYHSIFYSGISFLAVAFLRNVCGIFKFYTLYFSSVFRSLLSMSRFFYIQDVEIMCQRNITFWLYNKD